jgi:regulator of RNase E activity RraA
MEQGAREESPTGNYVPLEARDANFERADPNLLAALRAVGGLTATVSDVLERYGLSLAVSAGTLVPRHRRDAVIVGQALTLRYLPERTLAVEGAITPSKLAHATVASMAQDGDVLVVDAAGNRDRSCFGGLAAAAASKAGMAAAVVDGAARDLDEIDAAGLALWSSSVTPVTGNRRLEAVAINQPICCCGVQVRAGDVVVADATGVCFVPIEILPQVTEHVLSTSKREASLIAFDS